MNVPSLTAKAAVVQMMTIVVLERTMANPLKQNRANAMLPKTVTIRLSTSNRVGGGRGMEAALVRIGNGLAAWWDHPIGNRACPS